MNVQVHLDLTAKQAETLAIIAIGRDLAGEDGGLWGKVYDAIKAARARVDASAKDQASRVRACERCGRMVTHSPRGWHRPFWHKCPHGRSCDGLHTCGACSRARDAAPNVQQPKRKEP